MLLLLSIARVGSVHTIQVAGRIMERTVAAILARSSAPDCLLNVRPPSQTRFDSYFFAIMPGRKAHDIALLKHPNIVLSAWPILPPGSILSFRLVQKRSVRSRPYTVRSATSHQVGLATPLMYINGILAMQLDIQIELKRGMGQRGERDAYCDNCSDHRLGIIAGIRGYREAFEHPQGALGDLGGKRRCMPTEQWVVDRSVGESLWQFRAAMRGRLGFRNA